MLKLIDIRNFQSHKHVKLELSDGLNVIVGKSSSGKTAILRAVNWLVNNRPLGFRFRSTFASNKDLPTEVTVITDKNEKVSHWKSHNGAGYTIGEHPFGTIGTNVPDMASSALNISQINLQTQLDPHFLITSSPAEAARFVSKVTRVEKVDEWVSKLNNEAASANRAIKTIDERTLVYQAELEKYEGLEKIGELIEDCKDLQSLIAQNSAIISLLEKLKGYTDQERHYVAVIRALEPDIDGAAVLCDEIQVNNTVISKLTALVNRLAVLSAKIDEYSTQVNEAKEQYTNLLFKSGICPTCLQPLLTTKTHKKHILEAL
jgi:energy-coupling factor transporter ATP-binding protein EcfA2